MVASFSSGADIQAPAAPSPPRIHSLPGSTARFQIVARDRDIEKRKMRKRSCCTAGREGGYIAAHGRFHRSEERRPGRLRQQQRRAPAISAMATKFPPPPEKRWSPLRSETGRSRERIPTSPQRFYFTTPVNAQSQQPCHAARCPSTARDEYGHSSARSITSIWPEAQQPVAFRRCCQRASCGHTVILQAVWF